jgi:Rieske Fe-S protein
LAETTDKPTETPDEEYPKPPLAAAFEGETVTRRTVFAIAGQAFGGLAATAIALPVVGFAVAPIFDEAEEIWSPVGLPDDFPNDSYRASVITFVPEIGEAGKTTVYIRRGNPELPGAEHESPEEFVAISTRCAHLGCPVRFVAAAGNFICPCHGGVYGFQGEVIGGPPVRPLDRFQTRINEETGKLEIGPRYSVTNDLEPVRARDPGEFTGGIWEYLYPPRPSVPPAP